MVWPCDVPQTPSTGDVSGSGVVGPSPPLVAQVHRGVHELVTGVVVLILVFLVRVIRIGREYAQIHFLFFAATRKSYVFPALSGPTLVCLPVPTPSRKILYDFWVESLYRIT